MLKQFCEAFAEAFLWLNSWIESFFFSHARSARKRRFFYSRFNADHFFPRLDLHMANQMAIRSVPRVTREGQSRWTRHDSVSLLRA
jgi:hypothetical protein